MKCTRMTGGGLWMMVLVLGVWGAIAAPASGHCQIPCGIYDDAMRYTMLAEHVTTIEKSMKQIKLLSANPGKNANQLARWVANKETHADALATIVTDYFLQQRIKPAKPGDAKATAAYTQKLVLCHKMLVAAMKCKQTTDLEYPAELRTLLGQFQALMTK